MPVYRRARGPSRGWPSSRQLGTYYVGHSNEHPRRRRHQRGRDPQRGARAVRALPRRVLARTVDKRAAYPEEFVTALTEAGWLAALIPAEYGGAALGISQAAIILEEINRSGGERRRLPRADVRDGHAAAPRLRRAEAAAGCRGIAAGELRLQAFGVTEPDAGSRHHRRSARAPAATATATRIDGQKIFISRALHSDLMLLLARTTPSEPSRSKTRRSLNVFLVDLREARRRGRRSSPIDTMLNHHTNEIFIDGLEVPAENLIGEEGKGFRYILDGMNAERILDRAAVRSATAAGSSSTPRRTRRSAWCSAGPIGQNQGVRVPDRPGLRARRGGDLCAAGRLAASTAGETCGGRGEHGEAALRHAVLGRRQRLPGHLRRRTASPASTTSSASSARRASTVAPVSNEHGADVPGAERFRSAAVVLSCTGAYNINNGSPKSRCPALGRLCRPKSGRCQLSGPHCCSRRYSSRRATAE